jgi:hypothetical protein
LSVIDYYHVCLRVQNLLGLVLDDSLFDFLEEESDLDFVNHAHDHQDDEILDHDDQDVCHLLLLVVDVLGAEGGFRTEVLCYDA